MISVRLHPYNSIMGRGLERISNMIIDETFIEDLDKLDSEESGEKSCSCFAENGCQERPIGRERRKFGHEWER